MRGGQMFAIEGIDVQPIRIEVLEQQATVPNAKLNLLMSHLGLDATYVVFGYWIAADDSLRGWGGVCKPPSFKDTELRRRLDCGGSTQNSVHLEGEWADIVHTSMRPINLVSTKWPWNLTRVEWRM